MLENATCKHGAGQFFAMAPGCHWLSVVVLSQVFAEHKEKERLKQQADVLLGQEELGPRRRPQLARERFAGRTAIA